MTTVTRNLRFKVRGRTAADWTSGNEVLLDREIGLETDTRKHKYGDGTTAWNSLPYAKASLAASDIEGALGVTSAADKVLYATGAGTWALSNFTAFGRSLVDDADAAAARTTLGLVIGTNVQAWDADLDALAGLSSAGLLVRTGAGTAAARSLVGTANEITVANGDGASGNPTLSLPAALTFTGKTVTGGTFAGVGLSGATTGPGGFGVDSSGFVTGGGSNGWTIGSKSNVTRIDYVSGSFRCLGSGNALTDFQAALLRGSSLRIDATPAASAATTTHKLAVNLNGTTYYLLLSNV